MRQYFALSSPHQNDSAFLADSRPTSQSIGCPASAAVARALLTCLILFITAQFFLPAHAHRFEWYDGVWAHEESKLNPDPNATFGALDNGLGWVLYPGRPGSDRLAIRLDVQAGSLMETKKDCGAADFISRLIPYKNPTFAKTERDYLRAKHGLRLSSNLIHRADEMATVYGLNLYQDNLKDLEMGLGLLRQVADGLEFSNAEIASAVGPISAALRRESPEDHDIGVEWRRFFYAGTRFADCPHGDAEAFKRLNAAALRHFYKKWYIPGRMVVTIVGDIDPKHAEAFVKRAFGSMKKAPLLYPDDTGAIDAQGLKAFVKKTDSSSTEISFHIAAPIWPVTASVLRERYLLMEDLLKEAVNHRLAHLSDKRPDLWTEAEFFVRRFDPPVPSLYIRTETVNQNWKDVIKEIHLGFESLRHYGLSENEWNDLLRAYDQKLRYAVNRENRRSASEIADTIVDNINKNRINFSAKQNLDRFHETIRMLDLKEFNDSIRILLSIPNRRLKIVGHTDVTASEVLDYWRSLEKEIPAQARHDRLMAFPYLEEPVVWPQTEYKQVLLPVDRHDFFMWTTTLKNGITVYLQPLQFQKGRVDVDFTFGDGLMGVNEKDSIVARLAMSALHENGIGRLSKTETKRLFDGRGLKVSESVTTDYNRINGRAQKRDLEKLMQGVWTQFKDPFITVNSLHKSVNQIRARDGNRLATVEKRARTERGHYFTGSLVRSKPLHSSDVKNIGIEELRNYVSSVRNRGRRILHISGDFDPSEAAHLANKLFGTLPAAEEPANDIGQDPVFPSEKRRVIKVPTDKSQDAVVMIGWHSNIVDVDNREQITARTMAALIINQRLRSILKTALPVGSKAHSSYHHEIVHDGFGYLLMEIETCGSQVDKAENLIRLLADSLTHQGVLDSEVDLARASLEARWHSMQSKNVLWAKLTLKSLVSEKPYVAWFEETGRNLQTLTADDINEEIRRMLQGSASTLLVTSI